MLRIDDIRQRLAAATPWPWRNDYTGYGVLAGHIAINVDCVGDDWDEYKADAALIAAAPADLAYLLAEVERLRAEVADLREQLIWTSGHSDFGHGGPAHLGWETGPAKALGNWPCSACANEAKPPAPAEVQSTELAKSTELTNGAEEVQL